jgi:hypothetical protein
MIYAFRTNVGIYYVLIGSYPRGNWTYSMIENNSSMHSDSADTHKLQLIHLERMLMLVQMRRKMLSNLPLPHGTPIDRAK